MSYYIVLSGTLGSGKSTCAKRLVKDLNAERIDLDAVLKENKLDHYASNSACILAENFIKGLDIVIPITKELLKKDKIVIFDGCIYHKEVLDYLIKNLTFDSYIFTLKASLNTCIQRDKDRKRTIGEGVAEEVYNLVCNNNFGILIDTQGESIEETIDEIKNNLKSKNKYKST
ncbi:AAA family ATPase [archaeon]|jgi:predicted kinase|nr:AAA family ATPase [archaeon]MBT3465068.1 AAA family ATPase [archaeon]MBT6869259.1 AAA family ATPase [archaeon]MBT7193657.1 AAA family ATPase [archaeon]MBT7380275.1 AAA family ATPase [archaeon]